MHTTYNLVDENLAAATEQAILTTDLHGVVQTFSRGAELLLGFTADDVQGHPLTMLDQPATRGQILGGTGTLDEQIQELVRAGVPSGAPRAGGVP